MLTARTSMGRDLPTLSLFFFYSDNDGFPGKPSLRHISHRGRRAVAPSLFIYATALACRSDPISRQVLGRDPSQHDSDVLRRVGLDLIEPSPTLALLCGETRVVSSRACTVGAAGRPRCGLDPSAPDQGLPNLGEPPMLRRHCHRDAHAEGDPGLRLHPSHGCRPSP